MAQTMWLSGRHLNSYWYNLVLFLRCSEQSRIMSLSEFPEELIHLIANTLEPKDLTLLMKTTRRFHDRLRDKVYILAVTYIRKDRQSVLKWAVSNKYEAIVHALLQRGASDLTRYEGGDTILHDMAVDESQDLISISSKVYKHSEQKGGDGVTMRQKSETRTYRTNASCRWCRSQYIECFWIGRRSSRSFEHHEGVTRICEQRPFIEKRQAPADKEIQSPTR